MSLILDALKKLDREKSSNRDGMAKIAVEILRHDPPRPAKRMFRYFVAVSITAVATACATYAVIVGFGIFSKSSPSATVSPPPGQQVTSAAPARDPASSATEEINRPPTKIKSDLESKESAIPPSKKEARQDIIRKEPPVAKEIIKKSAEPATRVSVAAPPSLKLSGIIWQEEPSERRAMINGKVASEGSVIEGVKVVEIHPARVRFSHSGKTFEIFLGQ
jgi:general secretion pathway protein B